MTTVGERGGVKVGRLLTEGRDIVVKKKDD